MDKKSLITIEDLKEIRPLSEGIPSERISPYIAEAHFHDLRPVLGETLYYEFMLRFDDANVAYDKYRELLNGKVYADANGNSVDYPGVRPLVAYFALARFYSGQPVNVTKFGLHQKNSDQSVSQPLDPRVIAAEIAQLRAMGVNHQNLTRDFLALNVATYPLYNYSDSTKILNTGGVKFF